MWLKKILSMHVDHLYLHATSGLTIFLLDHFSDFKQNKQDVHNKIKMASWTQRGGCHCVTNDLHDNIEGNMIIREEYEVELNETKEECEEDTRKTHG